MGEWVALLRGVNTGGVKVLGADLRAMAADFGWHAPATYLASGNLMFRAGLDFAAEGASESQRNAGMEATGIAGEGSEDRLAGAGAAPETAPDASGLRANVALARRLEARLEQFYGRAVPVLVRSAVQMRTAALNCPFTPTEGKHVHGFFLWSEAGFNKGRYEELKGPSEELILQDGIGWLFAPEGIGRSKLAERVDRVLTGSEMTGRNLNTIRALADLLEARGGRE